MTARTQQQSTWLAFTDSRLTVEDLWLHYFGIGGNLGVFELDAYLHGMYELSQYERNGVAVALNEMLDGRPHCSKAEFVHSPFPDYDYSRHLLIGLFCRDFGS